MGIAERFLAKGIRAVLSPALRVVATQVLKLVHSMCARFKDVCPEDGELKFAELPSQDRWLQRAWACNRRPLIDDQIHRNALRARQEIIEIGADMIRDAGTYARQIADAYFARVGLTYDQWMAAVDGNARPLLLARAQTLVAAMQQETTRLQAALRRAR
jgi:hypothetical protein